MNSANINTDRSELQKQACFTLTEFFKEHQDEVPEIEILPDAMQPPEGIVMQDGLSIGVPKKILALAFVEAKKLFFAGLERDDITSQQAFEASKVMLLFDPEHLTAANFRKRRLVETPWDTSTKDFISAIRREILFLNGILTSPLHRQSKSPTLWYHRTWLLDFLLDEESISPHQSDIVDVSKAELDAVFAAGERHPKNYYAWQYARHLFVKLQRKHTDGTDRSWTVSYNSLMEMLTPLVKIWCCKHPSDISGWSFLSFLLPRLESITMRQTMVEEVLDYAINLRFVHESLWVFLRTVLADTTLGAGRAALIETLQKDHKEREESMQSSKGDSTFDNRVASTLKWILIYSQSIPSH